MTEKTTTPVQKKRLARDILLLLAVPIIIIVTLACMIIIPQMGPKPTKDFVYSTCEQSLGCNVEKVEFEGDRITLVNRQPETINSINDFKRALDPARTRSYHRYDMARDSSSPISRDQLTELSLDPATVSSEGFRFERVRSESAGFLLWSVRSGKSGWELKNGAGKVHTVNVNESKSYLADIEFIGWVK